jgi:hypothetical protein
MAAWHGTHIIMASEHEFVIFVEEKGGCQLVELLLLLNFFLVA